MESLLFTSDSPYLTSDLGSLDEDGGEDPDLAEEDEILTSFLTAQC